MDIIQFTLLLVLTITSIISIYFLRYCKELTRYVNLCPSIKSELTFKPYVSLIIPTYNEAVVIEDKIKNTLQLNYPSEKLEIILIDSASTDCTVKIAERFDQIKTIKQTERQGKSAALAEVFKAVSGDVIVITDADALLDKDVLVNAMPYLSDDNVGAVTGKQILVDPNDTTSHKGEQSYRDFFDMIRLAESNMQSTMIFNGPFMAFKKEVLEAPSQNSVADDTEMAIQVIKKGYRTLYIQKAIFYENIPLSNKSRMKQKERRAQGLVQSFWRHRSILFNKKYGEFGTKIFPAEFAVHLILPFSLVVSIIISTLSLYANFVNTIFIILVYLIIVATYAISIYSSIGKFLSDSTKPKQEFRIRGIIITFYSFIQLQFALFTGALKLIVYGSEHKWEQIAEVRIKINK